MKYSIKIDQKIIFDLKLNVDIVDMAIFEFLKDFSSSSICRRYNLSGKEYYQFNWKLVTNQLPILGLNSRQSVYNRFLKLIKAGLIEPSPENQVRQIALFRFTESIYDLYFSDRKELADLAMTIDRGSNDHLHEPSNDHLHYNAIDNNTIDDKGEATPPHEFSFKKKEIFINKLLSLQTKFPDKYPKILYIKFAEYWLEADTKTFRLKYEKQQFFEIPKRLASWFSKSKDWEILQFWEQDEQIDLKAVLETL